MVYNGTGKDKLLEVGIWNPC